MRLGGTRGGGRGVRGRGIREGLACDVYICAVFTTRAVPVGGGETGRDEGEYEGGVFL